MDQLEKERVELLEGRFKSFNSRCRREFVEDFFKLYREVRGEEAYDRLIRYVAGFLCNGGGDPVLGCLREYYVGKAGEVIRLLSGNIKKMSKVSRELYMDLVKDRKEGLLR